MATDVLADVHFAFLTSLFSPFLYYPSPLPPPSFPHPSSSCLSLPLPLSLPLLSSSLSLPFPPSSSLPTLPRSILTGLRDVCVDWLNGEPVEDPAMKGEKDPKAGFKVEVPRKAVRPSSTQVCACLHASLRSCVRVCVCVPV